MVHKLVGNVGGREVNHGIGLGCVREESVNRTLNENA